MSAPDPGSPERMAMDAYPHRKTAQAHWLRGWFAGQNDASARAALVGSYAEKEGFSEATSDKVS